MPNTLFSIVIGLLMLLGSLLSYGIATAFIVQLGARLVRSGYTGVSFWKNVGVMTFTLLVTAAAHLVQIALWAIVLLLVGEISSIDQAFYLSAQNYAALGYGDIALSTQWRLLGPLEAINGLLLFGLSTAVMFAVMSRLVANRLRSQLRYIDKAVVVEESWRRPGSERRREDMSLSRLCR
jgi:Ion channel